MCNVRAYGKSQNVSEDSESCYRLNALISYCWLWISTDLFHFDCRWAACCAEHTNGNENNGLKLHDTYTTCISLIKSEGKKCFAKIQQMRQNDDSKQGTKRVELMFSKECEEKTYRQRFGLHGERKCSIPLRTIRVVLWRCFIFILRYSRAQRNRHKMCEIETNRQTMTMSSASAREYVSTLCKTCANRQNLCFLQLFYPIQFWAVLDSKSVVLIMFFCTLDSSHLGFTTANVSKMKA